jgi:HK97 family phage major capsid protein
MPPTLATPGPPTLPPASITFRAIETGDSAIDRLMAPDSGGGFQGFAHFVRTAIAVQDRKGRHVEPSDRELWRSWMGAHCTYRNWLAERDPRQFGEVQRAVTSPDGMAEASDPDGAALIPPGFIKEVWDKARSRVTPFGMTKVVPTMVNAGALPAIAETSRVDGSRWGGLLSVWEGEAQQGTKAWPRLTNLQYRLKKLMTLVPFTDELYDDAGMLEAFLSETVHKEFLYQINDVIIHGTGVGKGLGVVEGPGTIAIAKDTGQVAATITSSNIQNMWTQFHGPSRAGGVWFANEEFDPDSLALQATPLTGWQPPTEAPTLKGRPVHPLENCPAIGNPGDLVLGDFSQYLLVMGGIRKSISMHFKFDYHTSYGRFIYRLDALPLWPAPLTSVNGTRPKAPFLVLARR